MNHFYNEITYFLDQFNPGANKEKPYLYNTYFWGDSEKTNDPNIYVHAFRIPGATMGHVCIDRTTGKIVSAEVYEHKRIYCYTEPYDVLTKKLQEKFIGTNWGDLTNVPRR